MSSKKLGRALVYLGTPCEGIVQLQVLSKESWTLIGTLRATCWLLSLQMAR